MPPVTDLQFGNKSLTISKHSPLSEKDFSLSLVGFRGAVPVQQAKGACGMRRARRTNEWDSDYIYFEIANASVRNVAEISFACHKRDSLGCGQHYIRYPILQELHFFRHLYNSQDWG